MHEKWRSSASLTMLEHRARMLQGIRAFFAQRDVLELETPLLAGSAVTDVHLDSMSVNDGGLRSLYLNTSPEFCMKRFIAEHRRDVYQVCKSFRCGETGNWHNPEFSMLEWYRAGFSLSQLMQEVADLIEGLWIGLRQDAFRLRYLSYRELVEAATGINPHASTAGQLRTWAVQQGMVPPVGLDVTASDQLQAEAERDAWLDWLLSCQLLPSLAADEFTFIYDYPASQAALARIERHGDDHVARRFELCYGALELANGYDELTDADEQRARFDLDNRKRQFLGKPTIATDELLLNALDHGLPQTSGVAVGLDRLLACLVDAPDITSVLAYSYTKV